MKNIKLTEREWLVIQKMGKIDMEMFISELIEFGPHVGKKLLVAIGEAQESNPRAFGLVSN